MSVPKTIHSAILFCLAFVMAATTAYAQGVNDTSGRVGAVKKVADYQRHGVTIAALALWKPYTFQDASGKQVGYLIDLWAKWSEKTGIPIRFETTPWPRTIANMKSGAADIHSGIYASDERDAFLDFSEPILTSSVVLAIRKDAVVDCSNALSQGTVAVVNKTYAHNYVRENYPEATVLPFPSIKDAIGPFLSGKFDVLVGNVSSIHMLGSQAKEWSRVEICRTLFSRPVRAAVAEGNDELLKIVNEGFAQINQQERDILERRWFVKVEPDNGLRSVLLPAALVLVLIGGGVFWWVVRRS